MAYNKDIDYQALISEAVQKGDYASASRYEQQRNEKIEKENLSYEKTNNYTMPNGVNGATYNKMNTPYKDSAELSERDKNTGNGLSYLQSLAGKDNIISKDVMKDINRNFGVPNAVTEADSYLKSQLELIQSGKTSYSDQVKDMMEQIQNREKFSYDVDSDPLFQQALASAMNSGKQAMQDTIGQASALTGGYGSTYATSAGNQAYNAFIEDAYDNLPQYYQMAMEAYQMEGDEMYRQFGMLSELDDKEYNRNIAAYDATYQHRNQLYNEAYNQFRDSKSDAFALANLQLSEHGQKVSDAYNFYSASSDYANTLYEREYTKWRDEVSLAMEYAQMLNSDWWNQSNQDFQASESQKQRDWQTNENKVQRDFQASEAQKDRDFTASENAKNRAASASRGSGGGSGGGGKTSSLTDSQLKTAEKLYIEAGGGKAGLQAVDGYLTTVGKNNLSEEASSYLMSTLNDAVIPTYYQNWTITKDTTNWFGGDDNNDKYSNGTTTMTFKELKKSLDDSGLSEAEQQSIINKWKSQSKK